MGAYLSLSQNTPDLPKDVVYSILRKIPVSDLINNALLVSKKWHQVGTSNAIWWPRYTTHLQNDPGFHKIVLENSHDTLVRQWLSHQHTKQSQWEENRIFRSFLRIWSGWDHLWLSDGSVQGVQSGMLWIRFDDRTIVIENWDFEYENAIIHLGLLDSRQVVYSQFKGHWIAVPYFGGGHGNSISIQAMSVTQSDYPQMTLLLTRNEEYRVFKGTERIPERSLWIHNLDKTPNTLIQCIESPPATRI